MATTEEKAKQFGLKFPGKLTLDIHYNLGRGVQRSLTNVKLFEDATVSQLLRYSKGVPETEKVYKAVSLRAASLPWHVWAIGDQQPDVPEPISPVESLFKYLQKNVTNYLNTSSITFVLRFVVNIRFRGEGMLPNMRNKVEARIDYLPSEDKPFTTFLMENFEPYQKGEVVMVDRADSVIAEPKSGVVQCNEIGEVDIFYAPARYNYSSITVAAFFDKVRSVHDATSEWLNQAQLAMEHKLAVFEAKEKGSGEKVPREDVLSAAAIWMHQLHGEKLQKWNTMIDALTIYLQKLNQRYKPRVDHLEQARRLVIDAFFVNVVDFLDLEFSVEIELSTSANKKSLGWGPLDYYAAQKTVAEDQRATSITIVEAVETYLGKRKGDEGEDNEEGEGGARSGVKSGAAETEDKESGVKKLPADPTALSPVHVEGKGATHVDAKGVAQTGSQLYDNHMRKAPPGYKVVEGTTVGVLSTGHRWLFFRLVSEKEHEKPLFEYLGEAVVTVLRHTTELPPAAKTNGTKKRRTSLKSLGDFNIDIDDVRAVAGSIAAALEGRLDVGEMTFASE